MARSLSMYLRERAVAAVEGGLSRRQTAARFGVSASNAIRWLRLVAREGSPAPKRRGSDRRSERIEVHGAAIRAAVAEKPDMTLAELRAWLRAEHGVSVAISTLLRFFGRHGLTLKKSQAMRTSRTGRMS